MSENKNPIIELLSRPSEPTALDSVINRIEKKGDSMQETLNPVIVLDETNNDDSAPISLSHRQPSFSSLHGHIIMKGGEEISDSLPAVEEISVNNSSENEEISIDLSDRQPSFSSFGQGKMVPKGGDKISKFKSFSCKDIQHSIEAIPENEEEDTDPQVIVVKQLKAKNYNRWMDMGYEPPKDLIPLARAHSQAQLSLLNSISSDMQSVASITSFIKEREHKLTTLTIQEESSQSSNLQSGMRRKRSSSFGMKLGEASSSTTLMKSVINENPNTVEMPIEEYGESCVEEDCISQIVEEGFDEEEINEEEEFFEEEDLIVEELFGRLGEIVHEYRDPELYHVLQNGFIESNMSVLTIRQKLKDLLKETSYRLWVEESEFVLSILNKFSSPKASRTAWSPRSSIHLVSPLEEQLHSFKTEAQQRIDDINDKMQKALDLIDQEYLSQVQKLDEKWSSESCISSYNKPSKDILNLRERAQKLLMKGDANAAKQLITEIKAKEEKEAKVKSEEMRKAYHAADIQLKQQYANKRYNSITKYKLQISKIENDLKQREQRLKQQISLHLSTKKI